MITRGTIRGITIRDITAHGTTDIMGITTRITALITITTTIITTTAM
jgi:hypothetical protein